MSVTTTPVEATGPAPATKRQGRTLSAPAGLGPLIAEAWYVIAPREDVGRDLSSITVLNQPLVFFRTEDGTPVVLDDRCAHRRYSLAKGHLRGDQIQCAYHGFVYDRTGACTFAPAVTGPLKFGVRSYPAVERGPWLWVWMGQGEGDPADIPLPAEIDQVEHGFLGYTRNPCNYLLLHENLLDLTHLYYLHGPALSTEEYANVPPKMLQSDDCRHVGYVRELPVTSFKLQALMCGADATATISRTEENWSRGPAINYASIKFHLQDGRPAEPFRQMVIHALTPESDGSTHQFWTFRFDAPLVIPEADAYDVVRGIFDEDVAVLEEQSRIIAGDNRSGVVENSVPSDVPGLRLRRVLQRLAAAESK